LATRAAQIDRDFGRASERPRERNSGVASGRDPGYWPSVVTAVTRPTATLPVVTENGAPRCDYPVTSRDRAVHLGGRAGNTDANKTNGQARRLPSVNAEVQAIVYPASMLVRPS
jgi:hypothetical protein